MHLETLAHQGAQRTLEILHSMLQPREDHCNLILELQTPLLEPCENLVGGRLFPRLDAIDISVDFVVALRDRLNS